MVAFHEIRDASMFRSKLEWLKECYEVVTMDELFRRRVGDRTMVTLTFDDGYQSWHEKAAPILTDLGLPAAFFVCSGFVGLGAAQGARFCRDRLRRKESLTPLTHKALLELASEPGFEIGSHTRSHIDLSRGYTELMLEHEIAGDKALLEDWTGRPVRWFAYPFGAWPQVLSVRPSDIRQSGFEAAFSIIPSFLTDETDRMMVGRDCLGENDSLDWWEWRLGGVYDAYHVLKGTLYKLEGAHKRP